VPSSFTLPKEGTGKRQGNERRWGSVVAGISRVLVVLDWSACQCVDAVSDDERTRRLPTAMQRTHFLFGRICLGRSPRRSPDILSSPLSSGRRLSFCCRWGQLRRQTEYRENFSDRAPTPQEFQGSIGSNGPVSWRRIIAERVSFNSTVRFVSPPSTRHHSPHVITCRRQATSLPPAFSMSQRDRDVTGILRVLQSKS
jgi:hypothetical protein